MYFYWLLLQKCNFRQAQYKLPEDGPGGLKHVGANVEYFNVNFNILPYFPTDNAHLTYNAHPKLFYIPFEAQITRT